MILPVSKAQLIVIIAVYESTLPPVILVQVIDQKGIEIIKFQVELRAQVLPTISKARTLQ